MKKKITKKRILLHGVLASLIVTSVLVSVGCGKKATPENLLNDVNKNLKEVKSVSANMNVTAEMEAESQTAGISMDMDVESTKKPAATHMKGSLSFKVSGSDRSTDVEVYAVEEDDELAAYTYANGEWSRSSSEDVENAIDENVFRSIGKANESFEKKEKLVDVNDKECFELEGEVEGKVLSAVIGEGMLNSFDPSGSLIDDEELAKKQIPCTIDIYKDTILPARIHVDLKEIAEEIYGESSGELEVKDYYVEINYHEYDKVDKIKVPGEALEATAGSSSFDFGDNVEDKGDKAGKENTPAKQSKELKEEWNSYTVQINDKVVTLPCKIEELEAAGLVLDTEDTAEDYVVNAGEYELVFFEDTYGNSLMVDMINQTEAPCKVGECLVGGIDVDSYSIGEGGLTVIFPGGIQIGSGEADVLSKYGETDDEYKDENYCSYSWYEDDSYDNRCQIQLETEGKTVNQMTLICHD
ncbi:DUF6612 family protein [Extibacter muris]|uniref:DUF6612 family protein n=1 Tax=Extibacter muris TaxID=1796622 RepID=UPI001D073CC0|nr:DUF6612 family protein [Extibacter muris]MCB6201809.1 hypothetical protein [Extibacter muris]MCQ4663600.1 hypothetical protein [Extibacter muris]MCQ4695027.1 hypothetical protein [Extibacter muris]